ncbi:MAG: efflux RND transporter periplasmic adaptor subunit [Myxococcota bacterium]
MRRVLLIFTVLITALSIGLWAKVREAQGALEKPSGGSGVIEGTRVHVVSRLAARILKIHVHEGDQVTAGQTLVELDCADPSAIQKAAEARLRAAESAAQAASAQVRAALGSARAAQAAMNAASAQSAALTASRDVTSRQAERINRLKTQSAVTDVEQDRVSAQVTQLTEQLKALDAQQQAAKDQAEAARSQADAVRNQAESALAAVGAAQADLARAEAAVKECVLTAPRGGQVEVRAFEEGEAVLPGSRILEIVDLNPVETVFYLPSRELPVAAPGKSVTVIPDAMRDHPVRGKIVRVASEAEFTPRNVQTREDRDRLVYAIKVEIPNPDQKLRAGMPVEVTIDGTGAPK